jgi:hypothetical protein
MDESLTTLEQADAWTVTARAHWRAGRLAQAAAYNIAASRMDVRRLGDQCSRRRECTSRE